MSKVVTYEIKSKMSEISSRVMGLKKQMWTNDRRSHNKLTKIFKEFHTDVKEITRHYVMMDPEVSPKRATEVCQSIIDYINQMDEALGVNHNYIDEFLAIKKEADALIVLVAIDDHEKSFFA